MVVDILRVEEDMARIVVQKCLSSSVSVDGRVVSSIDKGLCVFIGFAYFFTIMLTVTEVFCAFSAAPATYTSRITL